MRRSSSMSLVRCMAAVLLDFATPCMAWDNQGHMATGAIAYDVLASDPASVASIVKLMNAHPDRQRFEKALANLTGAARTRRLFELMARWPDDIRGTSYDRPEWHYAVKIVSGWTFLRALTFGDAVDEFDRQLAAARDLNLASGTRAVALCWVFHITGDMHQQLHGGHSASWRSPRSDRAGTIGWVRMSPGGTPVSLHEFWENAADMPGTEIQGAETLASIGEHVTMSVAYSALSDTQQFSSWVDQSRDLASTIAYRGAALDESAEPASAPVLSAAYRLRARQIADHRVGEAGRHIAALMWHIP